MEYKIKFTEKCLEDIDEVCEYILHNFKSINSANRLREQIFNTTDGLIRFPEIYPKINKLDRLKREYRRIIIDNYILLYTVDHEERIVYISHMFYGRKKLLRRLNIKFC